MLAAQRALQVLIESMAGLSRYVYQEKFGTKVSEAIIKEKSYRDIQKITLHIQALL